MEAKKYRVLLVNEEELLKESARENGLFSEVKQMKEVAYEIISSRCKNILSIMYSIKISKKMNLDYVKSDIVALCDEIEKKEKEYEKDIEDVAKKEEISQDFLRMIIMMEIAKEHGGKREREIAKQVLSGVEESRILAQKYIKIIELKDELDRKYEDKAKLNREIELVSYYIDLYRGTLGFNKAFIKNGKDKSTTLYIDEWHENIQNAYKNNASLDELLKLVATIEISECDISKEAFRVIRKNRDVDYAISKFREEVNNTIDICLGFINGDERVAGIVQNEPKANVKNYIKDELEELRYMFTYIYKFINKNKNQYLSLASQFLCKQKADEFKESYDSFLRTETDVFGKIRLLKESDIKCQESIVDLEEIRKAFESIDFEALDKIIHELHLYIDKQEISNKKLRLGKKEFIYNDGKLAFERVEHEVFDGLFLYIRNMNSVLAEDFKKGEKIVRKIEEEKQKELQGKDNINRFFKSNILEKYSVMTFNYTGSALEKYKTAAIIFDTEDMDKINQNSKKTAWNGKEDRSKINGKGQFMQGRYLFADNNKKILACEVMGITEYGKEGVSMAKQEADCIKRLGSLFDYRKSNMIICKEPQTIDKKQYGKVSVIDRDTEDELIQIFGKEEKENAGFLYVESAEDLERLIESL